MDVETVAQIFLLSILGAGIVLGFFIALISSNDGSKGDS